MIGLRLATYATKRNYRSLVIADNPNNNLIYRLGFVTPRKLINLLRVRKAYQNRQQQFKGNPVELRVDPTNLCNLSCPLCPTGTGELGRKPGIMSVSTFKQILDRHYRDIFEIKLHIWGEPLLNPDLAVMIDMATRRRVGTEISTNLSVVLSDTAIEELIRSGLTWLIISIDGISDTTYSQYRIGGDFNLVMSNIQRIVACRERLGSSTPFIEWQFVPFRHNEHEIDSLVSNAKMMGMDGVRIKPLRLDKTEGAPGTLMMAEKKHHWMPAGSKLAHKQDIPHKPLCNAGCGFLWYQVAYHYDGGIAPCCEAFSCTSDFGHLDEDFASVWQGHTYTRARSLFLNDLQVPNALFDSEHKNDPVTVCKTCSVFTKVPVNQRVAGNIGHD